METIKLKSIYLDHLTDEEFFHFCQEHKDLRIERTRNQEIIIMPPVSSDSGNREGNAIGQLYMWNQHSQKGKIFSSSAGFSLPDGSVFSADASWVSLVNWNRLSPSQRTHFASIVPEFVIEIRSKSDRPAWLSKKMKLWMENGVQLAWLIDPFQEQVTIYRHDASQEVVSGFDQKLSGETVLPGFEFQLAEMKLDRD